MGNQAQIHKAADVYRYMNFVQIVDGKDVPGAARSERCRRCQGKRFAGQRMG